MYGWTRSTPVSRSATVTPAPENPGIPTSGRRPPATSKRSSTASGSTAAGIAALHREDAPHVGIAHDDREGAGVERGREPVEHPVVRVLGLDRGPAEGEPRDHVALGACGQPPSRRAPAPRSRRRRRRQPASRATASRARRSSGRRAARTAGRRAGSPSRRRPPPAARRRSPRATRSSAAATSSAAPAARDASCAQAADAYASRIRASGERERVGEPGRRGDHGGVVGAERERRERSIRAGPRGARCSRPRPRRRRSDRCPSPRRPAAAAG